MSEDGNFWIRFWGVRGSLPCPGQSTERYGGNTSCLELHCGENLFVLDGGSGMRPLGMHLVSGIAVDADIFYTHTHLDHVIGFPFFVPFFSPNNKFRLHAGHLLPDYSLRGVLEMMLTPPLFPVPLDIVQAKLSFNDFQAGETIEPRPGVTVHTTMLNHPNNSTGYRFEYRGKSICYVTDTEHVEGERDQNIVNLIRKADIVIYDCTYTDDEYPLFRSWGHSTWQEGIRLCDAAEAKKLVIFHHEPSHSDDFMDALKKEAEQIRPGTVVAYEGMILTP